MEPWGIIMTAFTLFGMLVLAVVALGMTEGESHAMAMPLEDEPTAEASDLKKAA
jgi:hypothetical protein